MVGGGQHTSALDRAGHRGHIPPHAQSSRRSGRQYHISRNKEVYDAQLYALCQALQIVDEGGERVQHYNILTDCLRHRSGCLR